MATPSPAKPASVDEVTTGVRSVLSRPSAYELFARLIGGPRGRVRFVDEYLRPAARARVLDVGCGTGALLEVLHDVRYVGIDISPDYIEHAGARFADRDAEFRVGDAAAIPADLGTFDLAVVTGVLHHLSDDQALRMVASIASALSPDGRFVALENAFVPGQSPIARALIRRDRGQHVRAPEGYVAIAEGAFEHVDTSVIHDLLRVPYTHCILECRGPRASAPV